MPARLKAPPTVFTGKFTLGYPYVDLLEGGHGASVRPGALVHGAGRDAARPRHIGRGDGRLESAVVSLGFALRRHRHDDDQRRRA